MVVWLDWAEFGLSSSSVVGVACCSREKDC